MRPRNNNYKIAKIQEYNLTDEDLLILEEEYDGDIDRFLTEMGFEDGNV